MADNNVTLIRFVLDETGSMHDIRNDTIGGFNSYIEKLRASTDRFEFTLSKFDSNHHTVVCEGVAIERVPFLTPDNYRPGASTPLVEVATQAIEDMAKKTFERGPEAQVQVVIQTDGFENSSRPEYTFERLSGLIKEKEDAGWLFIFLGAGIDAFDQGQKMGFRPARTMQYDRNMSRRMFESLSASSIRYSRSRVPEAAQWSIEERQVTGGHEMPEAKETKQKEQ